MNITQAAERAGVTYRQALHWAGKGYISDQPVHVGSGAGGARLSAEQVERLCILADLTRALAISPAHAGRIAKRFAMKPDVALRAGPFLLSYDPEEEKPSS